MEDPVNLGSRLAQPETLGPDAIKKSPLSTARSAAVDLLSRYTQTQWALVVFALYLVGLVATLRGFYPEQASLDSVGVAATLGEWAPTHCAVPPRAAAPGPGE